MLDILFACISDIHIKENNKDKIERKLTSALESIKAHTLSTGRKHCIIIFPGDLAYSGIATEYAYLEQILKNTPLTLYIYFLQETMTIIFIIIKVTPEIFC